MSTNSTIALIGNPNCGKTTLFNALTGANQRTGNWPGVTVDRKEGRYKHNNETVTVVDLPGVYALDVEAGETGLDELVARDYLLSREAGLVVNIIDASNLERNLYLTTQLLEMGLPVILALNMLDIAEKRGLQVDSALISQNIGYPVLPIVAATGAGIPALKDAIARELEHPSPSLHGVGYPAAIEDAIAELVPTIQDLAPQYRTDARWIAVNLLQYDDRAVPELSTPEIVQIVARHRRDIHQRLGEDIDILVADSRYGFIQHVASNATERRGEIQHHHSDAIDRIVLNRWLGIPIFFGVMYLMFLFTIDISSAFIDFFDIAAKTIFVEGTRALLETLNTPGWIIAMLADGAGRGIQTVSTFIPVIGFMFFFLSLLEDSGYMARAAFVMDRLMRAIGLPGKAFVPMLVGFGCNVPAIMATRTLENSRDRLITITMNPFMSCGARLPVYALFAAAFFPIGGQNIVFGLYLLGIAAAIFTGLVLKNTLLRGPISPFIMELPPYHLPRFKGVLLRTWDRLRAFLFKAGKLIVVMVMVLGLLNSIGVDGSFGNQNSKNSVLSRVSESVTPIFAPIGLNRENWPATVGLFTGVFAKEAMVGSLDSLYGQLAREDNLAGAKAEEAFDFWGGINKAIATIPANLAEVPKALLDPLGLSIASSEDTATAAKKQEVNLGTFGAMAKRFDGKAGAFAYLLFVLLYFPCVSATAAVYRETNLRWTIFVAAWTTGLAYWTASIFYQIATFNQHAIASSIWLVASGFFLVATFVILKSVRPVRERAIG